MNIYKGTTRIVVAFPSLGIAVKIARIRLIEAVRRAIARLRFRDTKFIRQYFSWRIHIPISPSFWNLLLAGVISNFSEWKYAIQNGTVFIAPTYLSFGIFSIISYAEPLSKKLNGSSFGIKTYQSIMTVMPEHELVVDAHHWAVGSNFGYIKGRLVICDYGSPKTQAILREYVEKLDALDLAKIL